MEKFIDELILRERKKRKEKVLDGQIDLERDLPEQYLQTIVMSDKTTSIKIPVFMKDLPEKLAEEKYEFEPKPQIIKSTQNGDVDFTFSLLDVSVEPEQLGEISASVAGAIGDYSSGNVRSAEEAIRDVAIAAISGAITGAIGVKFPGMNRLVEGGVDTTVATVECAAYAALDGDMTLEEKLAYIFDPGQMAVDFVTGVVIGEAVDGIGNKLPGGWFKGKGDVYSVGDAAFMDADDRFLKYIRNRVDVNGYYDIIAHGTPNGMQITHNGQHMIADHRTAAKLIQNADGYNGQGIRLLSCNTGALDNGFAQNLANQLNVEVYAPTNYLWAKQDRNYFVAGMTNQGKPNMSELGIFKLFIPGGNQ